MGRHGGILMTGLSASYVVTLVNDGTITASNPNARGVYLLAGATVTNAVSASIVGAYDGVAIGRLTTAGAGVVINAGTIAGNGANGAGVSLASAGTVSNAASGLIVGQVDLAAGGTLTNAGTIIGNNGTAVGFGGTGSNLLVLDPGYDISGLVLASASGIDTVELSSAASAGAVAGFGTQFINFGSIVFDPGAEWLVSGNSSGLSGSISGFTTADTIIVTGVTATDSSYVGGILTLDESGGSSVTLDLPGNFALANFHVTPGVLGGTEVMVVPCLVAGTRILTASGEVPVEALCIGDQVVTVHGRRLAPIVWLGHRQVNCLGHPCTTDVWPICVKAGAIADRVPHRDLWLSPEHAVLLRTGAETVLVPIRHLLNGTTIAQMPCETVTYWHVELASHDAIVAEGLPAETYLDTGNRADFANGGPAVTVHPTFADAVWRAKACAPQLRHGDALAALQYRLAIRAARCGEVQLVRSQTA
jgi:hypothetical protein